MLFLLRWLFYVSVTLSACEPRRPVHCKTAKIDFVVWVLPVREPAPVGAVGVQSARFVSYCVLFAHVLAWLRLWAEYFLPLSCECRVCVALRVAARRFPMCNICRCWFPLQPN